MILSIIIIWGLILISEENQKNGFILLKTLPKLVIFLSLNIKYIIENFSKTQQYMTNKFSKRYEKCIWTGIDHSSWTILVRKNKFYENFSRHIFSWSSKYKKYQICTKKLIDFVGFYTTKPNIFNLCLPKLKSLSSKLFILFPKSRS